MRTFFRLCVIACFAWFSPAGATEFNMSNRYAGTVIDHFQLDASGNFSPAILSEADMKSTFGTARLSVLSRIGLRRDSLQAGRIPIEHDVRTLDYNVRRLQPVVRQL